MINFEVYKRVSKAWLLIPPLAFLLKDIVATMAVLSREPGITANVAFYYAIVMLPGTLISGELAILINLIFGVIVGLVLYSAALSRGRRTSVSRAKNDGLRM